MKEKSYKECLAEHFSNLKFILENGTLDEKEAVLGPIWARADSIERRTGQRAPRITFEQIEKCIMVKNKSLKVPLEERLLYFFKRCYLLHKL